MTEYDYTAKRLGSKQPPYNHRIIVCEKCGQRGTDEGRIKAKDGRECQRVTHRSHLSSLAGLSINHVDQHCSYWLPQPQSANAQISQPTNDAEKSVDAK